MASRDDTEGTRQMSAISCAPWPRHGVGQIYHPMGTRRTSMALGPSAPNSPDHPFGLFILLLLILILTLIPFSFRSHHTSPSIIVIHTMDTAKPRSSRRLFPTAPSTDPDDPTRLTLPSDCELVAGTFVVFKWQDHYCMLQVNVTLYCWGRRRSGAIEHVLDKYGLTHSPQLYRINSSSSVTRSGAG